MPMSLMMKQLETRFKAMLDDCLCPIVNAIEDKIMDTKQIFETKIDELKASTTSDNDALQQEFNGKLSDLQQNMTSELTSYTSKCCVYTIVVTYRHESKRIRHKADKISKIAVRQTIPKPFEHISKTK